MQATQNHWQKFRRTRAEKKIQRISIKYVNIETKWLATDHCGHTIPPLKCESDICTQRPRIKRKIQFVLQNSRQKSLTHWKIMFVSQKNSCKKKNRTPHFVHSWFFSPKHRFVYNRLLEELKNANILFSNWSKYYERNHKKRRFCQNNRFFFSSSQPTVR